MSTRSTELFYRLHESAEKFDYFVCGVSGALFAYIGQNYHPQKLEIGISLYEPISLLFLAGAFFVGLMHVERVVLNRYINFQMLHAGEAAGNIMTALKSGQMSYDNKDSGETLDRQQAEQLRLKYLEDKNRLELDLTAKGKIEDRLYRVRNLLLLLGFATVFLSKLLEPYANAA